MIQGHHRTVSGFRKIGSKSFFFSYVEKGEPEQQESKPVIKDFMPKDKDTSEHKKDEFIKELVVNEKTCGCF